MYRKIHKIPTRESKVSLTHSLTLKLFEGWNQQMILTTYDEGNLKNTSFNIVKKIYLFAALFNNGLYYAYAMIFFSFVSEGFYFLTETKQKEYKFANEKIEDVILVPSSPFIPLTIYLFYTLTLAQCGIISCRSNSEGMCVSVCMYMRVIVSYFNLLFIKMITS